MIMAFDNGVRRRYTGEQCKEIMAVDETWENGEILTVESIQGNGYGVRYSPL